MFINSLLYVLVMSIRKTIRITKQAEDRIKKLVKTGKYLTQIEVIRIALNKGLDILEKE